MGVILVAPGWGGGGSGGGSSDHSHGNLASLNALRVNGEELLVNGAPVGEKAVEVAFEAVLTAANITNKYLELPEDCDVSRALTMVLESLPQRMGEDWTVVEYVDPVKDRISWAGLGMERVVQAGDKVSVNYYRKR